MTIIDIIKQPKYLTLSVVLALAVIAVAAWLPNLHLITSTMTSSEMSLWQKTNLLVSLLGSLRTNFTLFSRTVTVINAGLAGLQVSLLSYYLRHTFKLQSAANRPQSSGVGLSILGVTASMLGVGCTACGSIILTSVIGFGSTATVLGLLPYKGQEFGLLGIGVLLLAIYLTLKKINHPLLCGLKKQSDSG